MQTLEKLLTANNLEKSLTANRYMQAVSLLSVINGILLTICQ